MTPAPLREGRQKQICPTQLWVFFQVFVGWLDTFLFGSTAMCGRCRWRKVNKAGSFELPKLLRGNLGKPLNVMDRRRACAPLCGWHDLDLDQSGVERRTTKLFYFSLEEKFKMRNTLCCHLALPQSIEVEAGSETHECRQKQAHPAPLGLLAHPGYSASAPQSQFLHSLGELHKKNGLYVSLQWN